MLNFFFTFLCRYNCKIASFICKLSASVIINVNDAARCIVFSYLSKPEVVEKPPTPISDKEICALNYLSGYVVFKLLKKIRNSSKFNSFENEQFLNILECTLDKKGGNELIDSLESWWFKNCNFRYSTYFLPSRE